MARVVNGLPEPWVIAETMAASPVDVGRPARP